MVLQKVNKINFFADIVPCLAIWNKTHLVPVDKGLKVIIDTGV